MIFTSLKILNSRRPILEYNQAIFALYLIQNLLQTREIIYIKLEWFDDVGRVHRTTTRCSSRRNRRPSILGWTEGNASKLCQSSRQIAVLSFRASCKWVMDGLLAIRSVSST